MAGVYRRSPQVPTALLERRTHGRFVWIDIRLPTRFSAPATRPVRSHKWCLCALGPEPRPPKRQCFFVHTKFLCTHKVAYRTYAWLVPTLLHDLRVLGLVHEWVGQWIPFKRQCGCIVNQQPGRCRATRPIAPIDRIVHAVICSHINSSQKCRCELVEHREVGHLVKQEQAGRECQ